MIIPHAAEELVHVVVLAVDPLRELVVLDLGAVPELTRDFVVQEVRDQGEVAQRVQRLHLNIESGRNRI